MPDRPKWANLSDQQIEHKVLRNNANYNTHDLTSVINNKSNVLQSKNIAWSKHIFIKIDGICNTAYLSASPFESLGAWMACLLKSLNTPVIATKLENWRRRHFRPRQSMERGGEKTFDSPIKISPRSENDTGRETRQFCNHPRSSKRDNHLFIGPF